MDVDPEHFDTRVEQIVERMRRERLDTNAIAVTAVATVLILVLTAIILAITL